MVKVKDERLFQHTVANPLIFLPNEYCYLGSGGRWWVSVAQEVLKWRHSSSSTQLILHRLNTVSSVRRMLVGYSILKIVKMLVKSYIRILSSRVCTMSEWRI